GQAEGRSPSDKNDQPSRSATFGSTRLARRAGTNDATMATAKRSAGTPANVIGSVALTPTRKELTTRLRATAPARPSPIPASDTTRPCPRISPTTSRSLAPRATSHANLTRPLLRRIRNTPEEAD